MPNITHQHCFNHSQRMASARCPVCKRHFCKECVTEHRGKVLCNTCLAQTALAASDKHTRWAILIHAMQFVIGLFMIWVFFYGFAQLLLLIPTSFHEGSLWQSGWWQG